MITWTLTRSFVSDDIIHVGVPTNNPIPVTFEISEVTKKHYILHIFGNDKSLDNQDFTSISSAKQAALETLKELQDEQI